MEEYRQNGELLQANLYRLQKGEPVAVVENYYSENCEPVSIPMDVSLSPAQNAQRYFKLVSKGARREDACGKNKKEKAEQELEYLEQMEDDLRKCTDAREAVGTAGDARRLRPCAPAVFRVKPKGKRRPSR